MSPSKEGPSQALNLWKHRACKAIGHGRERSLRASVPADSVEAMERLLRMIDLRELGVLVEPSEKQPPLLDVEPMPICQQQASNVERPSVAGDFFASPIDRGIEQAKHVKLVGDERRVREKSTRERTKWVAHVEHHASHVLATGDGCERFGELRRRPTFNELENTFADVVDDDRREAANTEFSVAFEEVLVDADRVWPRIEARTPAFLSSA